MNVAGGNLGRLDRRPVLLPSQPHQYSRAEHPTQLHSAYLVTARILPSLLTSCIVFAGPGIAPTPSCFPFDMLRSKA